MELFFAIGLFCLFFSFHFPPYNTLQSAAVTAADGLEQHNKNGAECDFSLPSPFQLLFFFVSCVLGFFLPITRIGIKLIKPHTHTHTCIARSPTQYLMHLTTTQPQRTFMQNPVLLFLFVCLLINLPCCTPLQHSNATFDLWVHFFDRRLAPVGFVPARGGALSELAVLHTCAHPSGVVLCVCFFLSSLFGPFFLRILPWATHLHVAFCSRFGDRFR